MAPVAFMKVIRCQPSCLLLVGVGSGSLVLRAHAMRFCHHALRRSLRAR
nr:MAG TPA: hypothetical protein [Herelleviridae sp.]